jgi:hypothetical protein
MKQEAWVGPRQNYWQIVELERFVFFAKYVYIICLAKSVNNKYVCIALPD